MITFNACLTRRGDWWSYVHLKLEQFCCNNPHTLSTKVLTGAAVAACWHLMHCTTVLNCRAKAFFYCEDIRQA